ncbi:MAG: lytic transglycosylase domain-containing protein [Pseudomonadota bacterium]
MKPRIILVLCAAFFAVFATRPMLDRPDTILATELQTSSASDTQQPQKTVASAEEIDLGQVFSSLSERDYDAVRQAIAKLEIGSIEHKAVLWAFAQSGAMHRSELRAARAALAGWPGDSVLAAFEQSAQSDGILGFGRITANLAGPLSEGFETAIVDARKQLQSNDPSSARETLLGVWIDERLSAREENLVLNEFAEILTEEDNARRYFNMMSRDRVRSGTRLAEMANMRPLHEVWTALIRGRDEALTMLDEVPESHRSTTAFKFIEIEALRKSGLEEQAASALSQVSTDPNLSINPDAWWVERRIISRSLREAGKLEQAYELAAAHVGGSNGTRIEAHFHAGWYALQLERTEVAARHFRALLDLATTPISISRGQYWLGRSLQSSGNEQEALDAYRRAAQGSTTFYGLLAAQLVEKAGEHGDMLQSAGPASPSPSTLAMDYVAALAAFNAQSDGTWVREFSKSLTDDESAHRHATASSFWLSKNGYAFEGLRLAKAAHRSGHFSNAALYPLDIIPVESMSNTESLAFSHAIARQESEFRIDARSSADALGLMQLLPRTAEAEADRLGLAYFPQLLTSDAGYNARLGISYAARQLDRFDGSYVLALIAYNAGPGRARQWVERFGTPVGLSLNETIDWIEQIPFPETRNYVFRVLENYAVYRDQYGLDGSLEDILVRGYPAF